VFLPATSVVNGDADVWGTAPQDELADSNFEGVIEIFRVTSFCPHLLTLRSTQPLPEMSTKYFFGDVKAVGG
jgi:hypothetical protein